jgi:hypothetical protein
LRGAQVRDALKWSGYLNETIELFGKNVEVKFQSHHWPVWENAKVVDYWKKQRDLYKYIHDQSVNLMNKGYNGAEIADAQRSGMFPCATFSGSFDGPNKVFAWRSAADYETTSYINNRRPGELYISGGQAPPPKGTVPAGPFIAKADATTGREIWRTYLDNGNVSGAWIANTNLNILPDGNIVFAWSGFVALVDGNTGEILKVAELPGGEAPIADTNFKHVTIAPDGTLILKSQTRPVGCTLQGTIAIMECSAKGMKRVGGMNPSVGWSQRARISAPIMRPVSRSTIGCA